MSVLSELNVLLLLIPNIDAENGPMDDSALRVVSSHRLGSRVGRCASVGIWVSF